MFSEKFRRLLLNAGIFIFFLGCDATLQNEDNTHNQPFIDAEIIDERMVFESRDQLDIGLNKLKNMSDEVFFSTLSNAYYNGFVPVIPMVDDTDVKTIEFLQPKLNRKKYHGKQNQLLKM